MTLTMTPSNIKRESLIKIREKGQKINSRVFIIRIVIDPLASYDLSYFSYYWTHNHFYFFKNSIYLFLGLRYNIFCLWFLLKWDNLTKDVRYSFFERLFSSVYVKNFMKTHNILFFAKYISFFWQKLQKDVSWGFKIKYSFFVWFATNYKIFLCIINRVISLEQESHKLLSFS